MNTADTQLSLKFKQIKHMQSLLQKHSKLSLQQQRMLTSQLAGSAKPKRSKSAQKSAKVARAQPALPQGMDMSPVMAGGGTLKADSNAFYDSQVYKAYASTSKRSALKRKQIQSLRVSHPT